MKTTLVSICLLALSAFGQTATPSTVSSPDPSTDVQGQQPLQQVASELKTTVDNVMPASANLAVTTAIIDAATQPTGLPTYIGGGVAFNQIGAPRFNAFITAIYPVKTSLGIYSSTTADIIPVAAVDKTGRKYYAFQSTFRQGLHKSVYSQGKFTALLGGDAGAAFSQADPSGMNINVAASFTATVVYQFSPRVALIVPLRGLYTPQVGWNPIVQMGVLFKP